MGCRYSCTCGGFCPGCTSYEPETYCGEAEDVYNNTYGSPQQQQQEDEQAKQYYVEIEAEHARLERDS